MLRTENLSCAYNEIPLFTAVSFTLAAGALLLVTGDNGSGKTSLLRILCGLTSPTAGTVYWHDAAITEVRPEYHAELMYVGHLPGIKDDLTPLENLHFAQQLAGRHGAATPREALTRAGLAPHADALTRTLSAGQKRRIALARLLVTAAPLWVLDEPLTALDTPGRAWVENLLSEHCAAGGLAVLTSHQALERPYPHVQRVHLHLQMRPSAG